MERIECRCLDCDKTFFKGDEGDNEKFCLRCEREYLVEGRQPEMDLGRDIDLEGDHSMEPWSDEGDYGDGQ